jgi:protein disulfide-isomerase
MRLLPISLLCSLFATAIIADSSEKILPSTDIAGDASDEGSADGPEPTVFNGIQVPPLPDIEGEKFNTTVKDGYWFVKHHSSVSPS